MDVKFPRGSPGLRRRTPRREPRCGQLRPRRQACAVAGSAAHRSWHSAHEQAGECARRLEPAIVALDQALGSVLAEPLVAAEDIPAFDSASTTGWAVSGRGPWRVRKPTKRDLLGGFEYHESTSTKALREGQAAHVEAGDPLGARVAAVVSRAGGRVEDGLLIANTGASGRAGAGIRGRGADATAGDELLGRGERVTPAVAALAATAGHDKLLVVPKPSVAIVRIGDRLVDTGVSRRGRVRDTVSPALAGWINGLNASPQRGRWVTDGDGALIDELDDIRADVVVATGPASHGAIQRVLAGLGAEMLVAGVACQPGGSMLLAMLPNGRPLIHCAGGPADAVASLLTLLVPLVAGMTDQAESSATARFDDEVAGDRRRTTLLPVRNVGGRSTSVTPVRPAGPNGLFGLAQATALAVIPHGGVRRHATVRLLALP